MSWKRFPTTSSRMSSHPSPSGANTRASITKHPSIQQLQSPPPPPPPSSFMAVDAAVTYDPPKISVDQPLSAKMIASGTSPLTLSLIYPSVTTILHLTMPFPLSPPLPGDALHGGFLAVDHSKELTLQFQCLKIPSESQFFTTPNPFCFLSPNATQPIFFSQRVSTLTSRLPTDTTTFPSPLSTRVWSKGALMPLLLPCLEYC